MRNQIEEMGPTKPASPEEKVGIKPARIRVENGPAVGIKPTETDIGSKTTIEAPTAAEQTPRLPVK